jgi:hypothetical protein
MLSYATQHSWHIASTADLAIVRTRRRSGPRLGTGQHGARVSCGACRLHGSPSLSAREVTDRSSQQLRQQGIIGEYYNAILCNGCRLSERKSRRLAVIRGGYSWLHLQSRRVGPVQSGGRERETCVVEAACKLPLFLHHFHVPLSCPFFLP